ncbi:hypothetical protein [Schlesneria sp. T3-172]|uniref:hypothetical protein n=1 Tax=Schlesneria sphaerica TaxID=3373610 RepID=UPI0037C5B454
MLNDAERAVSRSSSTNFGRGKASRVRVALDALKKHHATKPAPNADGTVVFKAGTWKPFSETEYRLGARLFEAVYDCPGLSTEPSKPESAPAANPKPSQRGGINGRSEGMNRFANQIEKQLDALRRR